MMVRSCWMAAAMALVLSLPSAARAEEPTERARRSAAAWTPDMSSIDQSIREALADRNSQSAGVRFFYGGGYYPYRAYYRPYYGVGYSYFPASYYVSPAWGFNYYSAPYYASYYPSYTYTSFYAPYAYSYYAPPVYYAPQPVLFAPPPGYCGCYYW